MKIPINFALAALTAGALGCAEHRPVHYSSAPAYSEEVAPPPTYPSTVADERQQAAASAEAQSVADQDLATSVRHEFDRYGDLSALAPNIDVAAHKGEVTLTGSVRDDRDRQMIDAMVRNMPGVVGVNNLLRVADRRSIQPTGRVAGGDQVMATGGNDLYNIHIQCLRNSDRDVGARIADELRAETTLASSVPNVNILVADGRITLRGIVRDEDQRQQILSAVQRAGGVDSMTDELRAQVLPR